jgi:hypothetical protein
MRQENVGRGESPHPTPSCVSGVRDHAVKFIEKIQLLLLTRGFQCANHNFIPSKFHVRFQVLTAASMKFKSLLGCTAA